MHVAPGRVYLERGRSEQALPHPVRGVALPGADGQVHSPLARARTGRLDAAVDALEEAVALGCRSQGKIAVEVDVARLRSMPRFARLIGRPSPR